MSFIEAGHRAYMKDVQLYGTKNRPFLGIQNSAVISSDDGSQLGYAGDVANTNLVDSQTKTNGDGIVEDIPLDFRMVGISVLNSFSVDSDIQGKMFTNFMRDFTLEQRTVYISQFASLSPGDQQGIGEFVQAMIKMLNY